MIALDGPATGVQLSLRRAPMYLRLVQDTMTLGWDGLDQPDDTPNPSDAVHVYRRRPGTHTVARLCYRGKNKDLSGWWEFAEYEHMPEVDGEALRGTEEWREWLRAQPAIE